MKMVKTFDCVGDMPDDVCSAFYKYERDTGLHPGNDCWVDWYVDGNPIEEQSSDEKLVNEWLHTQNINTGEIVLIEHRW